MPLSDVSERFALDLDSSRPAPAREQFIPLPADGGAYPEAAYFAGNSLGLQPRTASAALQDMLDAWSGLAVHGHFEGQIPWMQYHQYLNEASARMVGAGAAEVTIMNTLTVNLHLLLASFYRPTATRYRILIEDNAFPSDSYAVRSHTQFRGFDPEDAVLRIRPRAGEDTLRTEDVIAYLGEHGASIATVLLGAVNYLTGEFMDMPAITEAGHSVGAIVGWDLAHAAGNVPLELHDWNIDFAAWCTYKYINSGPGSIAGAFIHERHLTDPSIPRLEGWWGNRAENRFEMAPISDMPPTAEAWVMSNPPILALAPLRASLEIFDAVGMPTLRARGLELGDYLLDLLDHVASRAPLQVVTPRDAQHRGNQLSIRINGDVAEFAQRMRYNWGVIPDDRKPDIIRMAPVPLYTSYHDCWRGADAVSRELTGEGLVQ